MQLTQEHFDKAMQNLPSQVALQKTADEINEKLEKVESALDIHTKALDRLLKDLEKREQEKDVSLQRLDRLEHWAQQVGEKLGVRIEL